MRFEKIFLFLLPCMLALFAAANAVELPSLMPAPQEMNWTSGEEAWLQVDGLSGMALDDSLTSDMAAIRRLSEKMGILLPEATNGNLKVTRGTLPDSIPAKTRHEAYQLIINVAGITVTSETLHGIHNGLTTLIALLDTEKGFPCVSILDWPDQQMRGTYAGCIASAEERFEQFVGLKLNLLVLEDGNLYDLDNPEVCAHFQNLAGKCRENYIEFVPELQSLGWGQFVLQREPRAVEARRVERAAFEVRNGRVYSPDPEMPESVAVSNASFESGLDGWKAQTHDGHWKASYSDDAKVVACDDAEGGHALQLTLSSQGTVRVEQDVRVQPNARYEVKCRIKTRNVVGDSGAYIEVYGVGSRGDMSLIARNSKNIQGTTDWQVSQAEFVTGAYQPARPGGAIAEEVEAQPKQGYEKVRIFVRLQDTTGTAWFDAVEVIPLQSLNPLANVVVTERAKVTVESADGAILYENGKDYTLDVPEIKYPYESGGPLQVILAPQSRIAEGDTLLLSFNQATREDITCCPSEPLYDEFMRKAIGNVVEKLNPNYLHIGHDEPRFFNRDQRCTDRNLSSDVLFADAIKRIYASAKEANPDIRVMLWDDAINPYQNGPHLNTSDAATLLPRDIIVCIWWYDNVDWDRQIDKSMEYFLGLGFEVTGSPWFRVPNAYHWAELFDKQKDNPKELGIIYTSWELVPEPWAALEFTAEHSWSFGRPQYKP